ncbi:Transcription factor [Heracleum sosnowskyi]|uniref:Transcription factor n=1 Tax=Heracleum sosnowskyi TaxID=360622 RepID=A0AAD8JE76_9APIA|nr:Transcription factor [Heracleum sosnowskyi]
MTSSFLISNQELATSTSTSSSESKRKKRRKIDTSIVIKNTNQSENQQTKSQTEWKSVSEHNIYASKLVDALRRRTSDSTVRETADRVLAHSAKGRSRWSRAIMTNRLKLQMKMVKHKNKRKNSKLATTKRSKKLIRTPVKKRLLAVQEKARDLSRLVPGCRKITFPNLLEEVSDYICALEMQVRTMAALTGLLTSSTQSI